MLDDLPHSGEARSDLSGRSSDADLLAAVRLQKPQALEILYDRYAGIVMALCLRIVRDRSVAGQIVETVFFELWKHANHPSVTLADSLVSYARRLAIQRRRSTTTADSGMMLTQRSDFDDVPSDTPNMRWQRKRMQRALARVPEGAREILEMVCLDCWDIVQVARRLNLTPAAVRGRFVAGMGAFRDALQTTPAAAEPFDTTRLPLVRLDDLRILVVDDEPDARRALTRALQTVGAIVTVATDAGEAMSLLPQANPDVLLSDLAMPDQDGFDLIRRVRRGGRTVRDLPAVALTAYADSRTRRDAMLAGFQTHVAKPVDPHELAEVIASLTGRTTSSA